MQKDRYDLEFQPASKRRMVVVWRFIAGICAIALLLAVVSVILLQKDGLISEIKEAYFGVTEPEEIEGPAPWEYEGSAVFLLSATDNEKQALRFVFLVRADMTKREIHIHPLAPDTLVPDGESEISLNQAQKAGGAKRLKEVVEALTESPVDRYITTTDDGFMRVVNAMGDLSVKVEERIDYRTEDFGVTLAQGTYPLDGDRFLRYVRYLGTLPNGLEAQGDALVLLLQTYLVPSNAGSPAQLEKQFTKLVDILETDVYAMEFQAQQLLLQALLQESDQIQFAVHVREGEAIE